MEYAFFGLAFSVGVLVGFTIFELLGRSSKYAVDKTFESLVQSLNEENYSLSKLLEKCKDFEEKYKHLVGELDRLREVYDTPVPFTLVESQKGLSFSQGELKKLLRDEEGGI